MIDVRCTLAAAVVAEMLNWNGAPLMDRGKSPVSAYSMFVSVA
jgi:hypothetical protein